MGQTKLGESKISHEAFSPLKVRFFREAMRISQKLSLYARFFVSISETALMSLIEIVVAYFRPTYIVAGRPFRAVFRTQVLKQGMERWQAGVHDGQQLFEEIHARGFRGSARVVRYFPQTLREKCRPLTELAPPSPVEQFSAREAVWLFIREQIVLTAEEQSEE